MRSQIIIDLPNEQVLITNDVTGVKIQDVERESIGESSSHESSNSNEKYFAKIRHSSITELYIQAEAYDQEYAKTDPECDKRWNDIEDHIARLSTRSLSEFDIFQSFNPG